jgi:hypothetical protein
MIGFSVSLACSIAVEIRFDSCPFPRRLWLRVVVGAGLNLVTLSELLFRKLQARNMRLIRLGGSPFCGGEGS